MKGEIDPSGILLKRNVVSDKAEFWVVLPADKIVGVEAVVLDYTGNLLFKERHVGEEPFVWDLRNLQGRQVAAGSYLIIAKVLGVNDGYIFKAKVGVKR